MYISGRDIDRVSSPPRVRVSAFLCQKSCTYLGADVEADLLYPQRSLLLVESFQPKAWRLVALIVGHIQMVRPRRLYLSS